MRIIMSCSLDPIQIHVNRVAFVYPGTDDGLEKKVKKWNRTCEQGNDGKC